MRRKRSKKRSTKSRHDSSESSIESEDGSKKKFDSRKEESKLDKSNGTESREKLKREEDDESVSDDSLEVVVVRKSLEKKCEKVISGRRSKTPRESSKETKLTKTHRSTRRRLKSNRSRASDNGESTTDRMHSFEKEEKSKEATVHSRQTPRTSIDEDKENNGENVIECRYRRDVTDSTSQETVERVVVTAMVHKGPDTPKSVIETSKEVTFDDRLRTEVIEMEDASREAGSSKVDDILEQSDESRSNLVQKAANLKKDVEEMRQQGAQEKIQQEEDSKQSQEAKKEDEKGVARNVNKEDVKSDQDKEGSRDDVDDFGKDQEKIETSLIEGNREKDEKGKTLNEIIISE